MSSEHDSHGQHLHGADSTMHLSPGSAPAATKVPLLSIFIYTTLMALASGFGALPFFIFGRLKPYWAGIANAVAVGVMLAASFDLLQEGAPHSPALTILGMVIGALFIKASQDYLSQFEDASFEDLQGADARKAMLIITVMAAHAFGEGSGVGVSYSGQRGWAQGVLVTIAIGLHNVPEGMAVAGVMMSKGSSPTKALYWTLLCSFPQAIVAVPSYMFVEVFSSLLPVALGFAAGCMVWIAFAELIPDALESADHGHVATAATFSAAWLQGLSMLIASLEQPSGALSSPIQADAAALFRQLLSLLPCLLAPCAAAFLACRLAPSTSLASLLGASAASLAWLGTGTLATLVLSGRATTTAALACAAGGAVLAAMMLVATRKSADGKEEEEDKQSDGGEVKALEDGANGYSHQLNAHAHDWHRNGMAPQPSNPWRQHIESLPVKVHHNGGTHYHPSEAHGRSSCTDSPNKSPRFSHGAHWSQGTNGHHLNGAAVYMMETGQAIPMHAGDSGLPQYKADKQQAHIVRGSPLFAASVLVVQGVPLGLALGRTVAADSDSTLWHALLPSLLAALPLGLACAGVGRAVAGVQGLRVPLMLAAGLACVAGCTVTCFLVGLPLGKDNSSLARVAQPFEAWVPLVEAAVAGALLLAAFGHAWPKAQRAKRVQAGVGLALGLGVICWLFQTLLCAYTPYCLG